MNDKVKPDMSGFSCPVGEAKSENVTLAVGGGGKEMVSFLGSMIVKTFAHPDYEPDNDSAILDMGGIKIGMTTDSFVVNPIFFPGGNIGDIAVEGTVNDLLVAGVEPMYLTLGLILEEGCPNAEVEEVLKTIRKAADEAGVTVVTGDTKVVERGHGDKIFINTSGVGILRTEKELGPKNIKNGYVIIVSGDVGRHGAAIMGLRKEIEMDLELKSDVACLREPIMALINNKIDIACMRDLTRGGLFAALVELAKASHLHFDIVNEIPVCEAVAGFCEILGLNPMTFANEGRFITIVKPDEVEKTLKLLHNNGAEGAQVIGTVSDKGRLGKVTQKTSLGTDKIVLMPSGEHLPRIC